MIDKRDFLLFISTKQGLDSNSIRLCRIRLNVFIKWLDDRDLKKTEIENFLLYLKDKGLKNNSINTYIFLLRHIKDYLIDRGFPHDFLDGLKAFKKNQPEIIIFTLEEIKTIINTTLIYGKLQGIDCSFLDDRYRTITMFLAYTGCRPEEAYALKVKDVDISAGKVQFTNTKTDKNRTNYVFGELKERILRLIKDKNENEFVFINALGKKMHPQCYIDDLKKRAKACGITKRAFPYNFRHSYITHQLEAGIPIQVVADLVGHADIQTTYKNYMHLADKTRLSAAMKHPLVRDNIDIHERIRDAKQVIESLGFDNEKRVRYKLFQNNKGLRFEIIIN